MISRRIFPPCTFTSFFSVCSICPTTVFGGRVCVCCITHSDCSCNRRRFPSSGVPSVVQNLRLRREIHPINLFFPPFNEFRHLVPFPILGRFFLGGGGREIRALHLINWVRFMETLMNKKISAHWQFSGNVEGAAVGVFFRLHDAWESFFLFCFNNFIQPFLVLLNT